MTNVAPEINSPASGASLNGTAVSFSWTGNGLPVEAWWIYAGTTAGANGNQFFDSGNLNAQTSVLVTNLPADGSTVTVSLWYRINGIWAFRPYTYPSNP